VDDDGDVDFALYWSGSENVACGGDIPSIIAPAFAAAVDVVVTATTGTGFPVPTDGCDGFIPAETASILRVAVAAP
jgi:hypothetical protein